MQNLSLISSLDVIFIKFYDQFYFYEHFMTNFIIENSLDSSNLFSKKKKEL
jgi:hypothetical protein